MKHIIIVDDDPAILHALQLILEREGYGVTMLANGQPLLAPKGVNADLVILDRQLSGADGLEICRAMKENTATNHIPVIMLSASPHVEKLAKEVGANAFLEKPFNIKHLLEIICEHTGAS